MSAKFDTVIIGGGQAGLAVSYHLKQLNRHHIVLERQRIGEAWRSEKWDSFTLVTPNWGLQLPGYGYNGDDPDGFFHRDDVVRYLNDYVERFNLPIRTGVDVLSVKEADEQSGFVLETNLQQYRTSNVVVATGTFQSPKILAFRSKLSSRLQQLHSSQYRNPEKLRSGAVLVVGSAQSGCQIADELVASGRTVYLSTGQAVRLPRRYRGKDSFWWADQLGIFDQTVDTLPSPEARFNPNPQVTGRDGGKNLSLHQLAEDGVKLLGRMQDIDGNKGLFTDDLKNNLAQADTFASEFKKGVDAYIEKSGMNAPAPEEDREVHGAGYDVETIHELDLHKAGISSVIWATGYQFDYSWIHFPVFDAMGYPIQRRGVTEQPGLYFVGLHWLHNRKSGLLMGVGDDAAHVAQRINVRAS